MQQPKELTLEELVTRVRSGEVEAYDQIVWRYQDMAVAYAYSLLGDFHLAQDAAQEAFVEAFCCLDSLQEPLAFASWLRRIVFKHGDRLTRKKRLLTVSLEAGSEEKSHDVEPQPALEQRELQLHVRGVIAALPEAERVLILLFYMGEHSQKEIAEFLELPLSTVKKRLYTARQKLREKMKGLEIIDMVQQHLQEQRPSGDSRFAERVKVFTCRLSQQLEDSQSLVRSLAWIAAQEENEELKQVIMRIQQEVTGNGKEGSTLSKALSNYGEYFSPDYVQAIRQGEQDGDLRGVLLRLKGEMKVDGSAK